MNDYIPAEDVEAPISFTARTGAGYDAGLLSIRGNDAAQFIGRLDEFDEAGGVQKVVDFNVRLQAAATVASGLSDNTPAKSAPPARGGGQRQGGNSRPAPSNNSDAEQHPEGLQCSSCGQVVVYKKIAKGSRTFELWTCPNQRQRNDGHHSEFIN